MKQIPILSGKAHVVELPEGATNHHIHKKKVGSRLRYALSNGINTSIELPQGNWKIVGMLSEVTEEQAAGLVKKHQWSDGFFIYHNYNGKNTFNTFTALESLDSAILAERYYLDNNPVPPFNERLNDWFETQSRVLSRERCLILRRSE